MILVASPFLEFQLGETPKINKKPIENKLSFNERLKEYTLNMDIR